MFIDFKEKGRKTEREAPFGCLPYTPRLKTEPATQACAPTRNRPLSPLVHRTMLQPTEPPVQGRLAISKITSRDYQLSGPCLHCPQGHSGTRVKEVRPTQAVRGSHPPGRCPRGMWFVSCVQSCQQNPQTGSGCGGPWQGPTP